MIEIKEYCKKIEISDDVLMGKSRFFKHCIARQVYWLYLKENGISRSETGRMFGRTHSTIINGIKTALNLIECGDFTAKEFYNKLNRK